eukprot:scaffold223992_cov20-Prasinocladus_malaysianus.AAC.1
MSLELRFVRTSQLHFAAMKPAGLEYRHNFLICNGLRVSTSLLFGLRVCSTGRPLRHLQHLASEAVAPPQFSKYMTYVAFQ